MQITSRHANETAREYAVRMLRNNIISLNLKPGSTVSVYELSKKLGISRTPVREALLELSKAKIIEVYPQKGSTIAYIDSKMVEEARFLREVLETAIVELACDVATEEDITELMANLKMQEFFVENPMPGKLLELDDNFHLKLFQLCDKEEIYTIKDIISIHFDRVRNMSLVAVKDIKIVEDHKQIIEAISNRNKEKARKAMQKHLRRYSIDDEKQIREKYPDYFKENDKWFVDMK